MTERGSTCLNADFSIITVLSALSNELATTEQQFRERAGELDIIHDSATESCNSGDSKFLDSLRVTFEQGSVTLYEEALERLGFGAVAVSTNVTLSVVRQLSAALQVALDKSFANFVDYSVSAHDEAREEASWPALEAAGQFCCALTDAGESVAELRSEKIYALVDLLLRVAAFHIIDVDSGHKVPGADLQSSAVAKLAHSYTSRLSHIRQLSPSGHVAAWHIRGFHSFVESLKSAAEAATGFPLLRVQRWGELPPCPLHEVDDWPALQYACTSAPELYTAARGLLHAWCAPSPLPVFASHYGALPNWGPMTIFPRSAPPRAEEDMHFLRGTPSPVAEDMHFPHSAPPRAEEDIPDAT
ncbi:hypothetical protein CYMTET_43698 [Cymbomonas tetramitiformis]|uniref:Uncharacterized protein n=1 Tax=Cymbomonas tetramitiformis TaxID=36881 RepID=A0AAE0C1P1_9CHLO|nr:hypothetical protein CYMTET_43698 [Cymbomonas tetramitiformis]